MKEKRETQTQKTKKRQRQKEQVGTKAIVKATKINDFVVHLT